MWRAFAVTAVIVFIFLTNLVQSLKCQVGAYTVHSGSISILNASAHHLNKDLIFHTGYNDEVEEVMCEDDENRCMRHEVSGDFLEEGDVTGRWKKCIIG